MALGNESGADQIRRQYEIFFEQERLIRSQVIAEAITLETLIDQIIAWYFCSDESKHPLLYSLLFREANVMYGAKLKIFKKVLKGAYPQISQACEFMHPELQRVGELRNKLAHCEIVVPTDLSELARQDGITIRRYKNGVLELENIASKAVSQQVERCRVLNLALAVVIGFVREHVTGVPLSSLSLKISNVMADLKYRLQELKRQP